VNRGLAWAVGIAILVVLLLDVVVLVQGPRDGDGLAGPTPTVTELSPSPDLSPTDIFPTESPTIPESPTNGVTPQESPPVTTSPTTTFPPTTPPTSPPPTEGKGVAMTGPPLPAAAGIVPLAGGLALWMGLRRRSK
jgi:hypothetical protein